MEGNRLGGVSVRGVSRPSNSYIVTRWRFRSRNNRTWGTVWLQPVAQHQLPVPVPQRRVPRRADTSPLAGLVHLHGVLLITFSFSLSLDWGPNHLGTLLGGSSCAEGVSERLGGGS